MMDSKYNSKQIPAHDTEYWQALDRSHHLHPFSDPKALNAEGSRVITHAEGIYLWDSDGNRILDGMAGLWCVNVGYGQHRLAEAAYHQLQTLPFYNCFFKTSHPPVIELARRLAELAPASLNHVFFTNSGSEANDTVIRMVRRYWDLQGQADKTVIISRHNAYHGSTMGGASLGGMAFMHRQGGLPIPDIEHIQQPYWYGEGASLSPEEFGLQAARALETKIKALGEHRVAAFIAEPIQGAGGVIIPPESYWPEIKRICARYDILLVIDEVICGFGRLGHWFGSQYYQLEPDLMPFAKGVTSGYLPLGGVLVSDKVAQVLTEHGGEFAHGFTYSGHPAACAVALANLELLQEQGIIKQVANDTGPYLQQRWQGFADHPLVGEVRGVGMLAALELVKDKNTHARFGKLGDTGTLCRDICFKNHLVMRAVGDTMIISPPLVITRDEIDQLFNKVEHCLNETAKQLGVKTD